MKTRTTLRRFVAFGSLGTLVIGGLATAMGQSKVPKSQFVSPATKSIRDLAGQVGDIKFGKEKKHGVWVFTGEWQADGVSHEAVVTSDGILIETEESVSLGDVPIAVRAAIAEHFGSNDKVTVEKKTIIVYEAEAEVNGQEKELLIFPTGRVLEQEHDDDDDDDDDHEGHDHSDHDHDARGHGGHDHDHDHDHDDDD